MISDDEASPSEILRLESEIQTVERQLRDAHLRSVRSAPARHATSSQRLLDVRVKPNLTGIRKTLFANPKPLVAQHSF